LRKKRYLQKNVKGVGIDPPPPLGNPWVNNRLALKVSVSRKKTATRNGNLQPEIQSNEYSSTSGSRINSLYAYMCNVYICLCVMNAW